MAWKNTIRKNVDPRERSYVLQALDKQLKEQNVRLDNEVLEALEEAVHSRGKAKLSPAQSRKIVQFMVEVEKIPKRMLVETVVDWIIGIKR
jgi:hypothetical protein